MLFVLVQVIELFFLEKDKTLEYKMTAIKTTAAGAILEKLTKHQKVLLITQSNLRTILLVLTNSK